MCLSMVFLLVLLRFLRFSLIREYANEIIYISDHRKKGVCLSFYVVPYLMLSDKQHSRYDCRCILILKYHLRGCHGNRAFSHSPYQFRF